MAKSSIIFEKNIQMEDDKFIKIRKTIQQTILPLVQAIYVEEPLDINQFCFQYFQKGGKDGYVNENIADGNTTKDDELLVKNEEVYCIAEKKDCDIKTTSRSIIQGSASMPVLISDKLPDCLPARETSSWNEPRQNSQKNGSRSTPECSLADAMSKIGDQASLAENSESPEMKRRDASTNIKNDGDTEFDSQNLIEENSVLQTGLDLEKSSITYACPSAPPCENTDNNLVNETPSTFENSQVKPLPENPDERSSYSDNEQKTENVSEPQKEVLRESKRISNVEPEKDEVKICGGKLSPNSSFGFIPQLQECRSPEEIVTLSNFSGDNCFKSKSANKAEKLTNDISEAFQGLAKEFSIAESNLNSEFLKAKEISDVIHGSKGADNFGRSVENYCVSEAVKLTEGPKNDSLDGMLPNEVIRDVKDSRLDLLQSEPAEMFYMLEETNSSPEIEFISYSNNQREDIKNESHLPKFTTEYKIINIKPEHDKEEIDGIKIDPILSGNTAGEEHRCKNNEIRSYVDESWRRRWYEVHPRLDNIQSSFRQRAPMIHPAHRLDESNRISRPIQGIGEAGDVARDPRFLAAREVPSGGLESYSESKLETNFSTSTFKECSNLYGSLSADEICHKMSSGRVACNFYNRDSVHPRLDASSHNIPYSWMDVTTKEHVSLTQSEDQNMNNANLKPRYEVNSEILSAVNYKVEFPEHDSTDDEFVEMEDSLCEYFEPVDNNCIVRSEENESDNEYEECVQSDNFHVTENYTAAQNNNFITNTQNGSDIVVGADSDASYENIISKPQYIDNKSQHNENIQRQRNSHEFPHKRNESHETKEKSSKHDSENERNGTNMVDSKIIPEKKVDKISVLNPGCNVKVEPGLNSACGDFATTNDTENNQYEFNIHPSSFSPDYLTNLAQVEQSPTETQAVEITQEEFEEVMRNVLNQQETYSDDSHMVLLEGYQESDLSNVGSSAISEEEDSFYNPENEPYP